MMLADPQMCAVGRLYLSDAAACAAIESQLFADESPWNEQMFREEIEHPAVRALALRLGSFPELFNAGLVDDVPQGLTAGQLVGYGLCALRGDLHHDPEFEVLTLALDPRLQGHGWGQALFDALLWGTEKGNVFLEVRADNERAIALYEKNGFHVISRRPKYYQPIDVDALVMQRVPLSGYSES